MSLLGLMLRQWVVGRQRIVGVHACGIHNDTVDDKDWLIGGIQRVDTTDVDGGAGTWSTRVGLNLHRQLDPATPGRCW